MQAGEGRRLSWRGCAGDADIEECELGSGVCAADTEVCENTPGSYRCVCAEGYTASGSTCVGELPPCNDLLDILC